MMKEKNIPLKNYILLSVILIISVVLVIYFYMWYGTYEENRLNSSIMDKYLTVINYNELDNYLVENNDVVIYISKLEDNDIRAFEKKFKNVIDYNSLNNKILYLNLTNEIKNNKLYENIKAKYGISDLPSIVIYRNGLIYDVFNIRENHFDINKIINYFSNEGVIDD